MKSQLNGKNHKYVCLASHRMALMDEGRMKVTDLKIRELLTEISTPSPVIKVYTPAGKEGE